MIWHAINTVRKYSIIAAITLIWIRCVHQWWRHQMGIRRSPVNSRTKASDAELWCFLWSAPWINGWVNNREAGDLRRHRVHYEVIVMCRAHYDVIIMRIRTLMRVIKMFIIVIPETMVTNAEVNLQIPCLLFHLLHTHHCPYLYFSYNNTSWYYFLCMAVPYILTWVLLSRFWFLF